MHRSRTTSLPIRPVGRIVLLLLLGAPLALADVSIPSFPSVPAGLQLVGNAAVNFGRLQLGQSAGNQTAAAWFITPQLVEPGFETTFQFQIHALSGGGADGLAFVIQNSSVTALGAGGGSLGFTGIPNCLAVEFDTWNNGAPENDANHISVQSRGVQPNDANHAFSLGSTIGTLPVLPDLSNSFIYLVKVQYVPGTMRVFLNDMTTPRLSVQVNLGTLLNLNQGRAWVGFTGATGGAWEFHDILSWTFIENPSAPPLPPSSQPGGHSSENHNGDNALQEVCGGSLAPASPGMALWLACLAGAALALARRR